MDPFSFTALVFALILSVVALIIAVFTLFFLILPLIRGAPYVPTPERGIKAMLELADTGPHSRVVDLGSGDGRILIAFAQKGIKEAHGYEINPFLVWSSRKSIESMDLHDTIHIHKKSLWKSEVRNVDCVTLYGLNHIMAGLEKKLWQELKPGARVVSHSFRFPNWPHAEKKDGVYLYIRE